MLGLTRSAFAACLTILVLSACADETHPDVAIEPQLTRVRAPARFALGDPHAFVLLVAVEGVGLDPTRQTPVELNVVGPEGSPVGFLQLNEVTMASVALGDGIVGLDLTGSGVSGRVSICATAEGAAGRPCDAVELFDADVEAPEGVVREGLEMRAWWREQLQAKHPGIRCRCDRGEIKLRAGDRPDGHLEGGFTEALGGARLGPYHAGNLNDDDEITSTMRLEAHFVIEIIGLPAKGPNITDAAWTSILRGFASLCDEGQNANTTYVFLEGKANEERFPDLHEGTEYPYDDSKDPDSLRPDGWGFVVPARVEHPAVEGWVKQHEANFVIHWLDAPGLNDVATDDEELRGKEPLHADVFLHAWVHGVPSDPDDDCDCYVGLSTGRVLANGDTADPRILSAPVCE